MPYPQTFSFQDSPPPPPFPLPPPPPHNTPRPESPRSFKLLPFRSGSKQRQASPRAETPRTLTLRGFRSSTQDTSLSSRPETPQIVHIPSSVAPRRPPRPESLRTTRSGSISTSSLASPRTPLSPPPRSPLFPPPRIPLIYTPEEFEGFEGLHAPTSLKPLNFLPLPSPLFENSRTPAPNPPLSIPPLSPLLHDIPYGSHSHLSSARLDTPPQSPALFPPSRSTLFSKTSRTPTPVPTPVPTPPPRSPLLEFSAFESSRAATPTPPLPSPLFPPPTRPLPEPPGPAGIKMHLPGKTSLLGIEEDELPPPAQSSPNSPTFPPPRSPLPQLPDATVSSLQRTLCAPRSPISPRFPAKASTTGPAPSTLTPNSNSYSPTSSRDTATPSPPASKPTEPKTTPGKRKPVPVKTDEPLKLPEAKTKLDIIIIGAGISGLTAAIALKSSGHEVTLLEASTALTEIAAGIQIAPNATRILSRLGLLPEVMQHATILESCSIRRWENDQELGEAKMGDRAGKRYGAPLGVVHRGDLQAVLLAEVRRRRIPIVLSSRVVEVDGGFGARVKLERGQWLSGDVVLACDGIRSLVRRQIAKIYGLSDMSVPTGDAAYRLQIPREKIEESRNERVAELIKRSTGTRWLGPGGHVMAYPIRHGTIYHMVLLHPDTHSLSDEGNTAKRESWTNKGSKKEMLEFYKGWNGTVRELINMVPNGDVLEWTLNTRHPLPSWRLNRCALLGDACHPMLPYVAQGAAQGIEDAAVLALTLSLIESKEEIGTALGVYELVRKERVERVQRSAERTRNVLHMVDGEEQVERDMKMRGVSEEEKEGGKEGEKGGDGNKGRENPDQWCDGEWQDFLWGTDVMQQTLDNWSALVKKVESRDVTELNATMYC